ELLLLEVLRPAPLAELAHHVPAHVEPGFGGLLTSRPDRELLGIGFGERAQVDTLSNHHRVLRGIAVERHRCRDRLRLATSRALQLDLVRIPKGVDPVGVEVLEHERVDALTVAKEVLPESGGLPHAEVPGAVEERLVTGGHDRVQDPTMPVPEGPAPEHSPPLELPDVRLAAEQRVDMQVQPAPADLGPIDGRHADDALVALATDAEVLLALTLQHVAGDPLLGALRREREERVPERHRPFGIVLV